MRLRKQSKWAIFAATFLILVSGLFNTAQARYLEPDPAGLLGPVNPWSNPYTYAGNNTYKYTDRLGLQAVPGGMDFGMGPTFAAITGAPATTGSDYLLANQALLTQDPLQDVHDAQMLQAAMLLASIPLPEFALEEAGLASVAEGAGAAAGATAEGAAAAAEPAEQCIVQFGGNENQISHAFRHIEQAGFNRSTVQNAIQESLSGVAESLPQGQYNGSVLVNGTRIDYGAYKLPNGVINVGRITPPR